MPEEYAHEVNVLRSFILKYTSISDQEWELISSALCLKSFKKGTVLLQEGQVPACSYFILKGCIRQYYLIDGVEKTTDFFTEAQAITLTEGEIKPAPFYLSCVEDVVVSVGTSTLEESPAELRRLEVVCRTAMEEELARYKETLSMFILNSPEDRYRLLLKSRPDLIERVPLYQLASYLGITPESLSRIRRRIARK